MSIHYYNHLKTSVTGSVVSLKTTRLSVLWKKKGSSTLLYNRSNKKVSFLLLHKHYINFRMMTVLVKLISFCYNINIIWRTDYIFNQDADRAEDWRILNRTWIWTTCTLVFIYQQVPVVCLMLHHHLVIQDIYLMLQQENWPAAWIADNVNIQDTLISYSATLDTTFGRRCNVEIVIYDMSEWTIQKKAPFRKLRGLWASSLTRAI